MSHFNAKKKQPAKSRIDPKSISGWDTNIAQAFNQYCQKSGIKSPEFKTTGVSQEKGSQTVSVAMTMADGTVFNGSGRDKSDAKRDVLEQYAVNVLGIDLKKEKKEENTQEDEDNFNIDDMYMHTNYDTGETYYTFEKHDKDEEESWKRYQDRIKQDEEKAALSKNVRDKVKQRDLNEFNKKMANAQVKTLAAEKGRGYEIKLDDGTKYTLGINYQDETKQKNVYRNQYDYFDKTQPSETRDVKLKTLTLQCSKTVDGESSSFTMQSSIPLEHATNPYALDLEMLSNLKMTSKNAKDAAAAQNANLLTKLLEVTNDSIYRAPKLAKQARTSGVKTASNGRE